MAGILFRGVIDGESKWKYYMQNYVFHAEG